ncbi:MAG: HD domain-containing protein, partial [Desulfosarcina sp.]|nr:HD domain-containing protein [Desulfobacterales bacterium]
MGPVYAILQDKARHMADRLPTPEFYLAHAGEIEQARQAMAGHGLLADLRALVRSTIENDFGHGLAHAHKVAVDAGALVLIEGHLAGLDPVSSERKLLVVQTAGLLHDICRKEKHHAEAGAVFARKALAAFDLTKTEVTEICYAIRNHEAFQRIQAPPTVDAGLVSDCLYDADKFRWGPDNFTDTLWDMVTFYNPPLSAFVARYPDGMKKLEENKATFRTATGKCFSPQMIDFGIMI